jgi:hypothetical protein
VAFDVVGEDEDDEKVHPFDEQMAKVDILSLAAVEDMDCLPQKDQEKHHAM